MVASDNGIFCAKEVVFFVKNRLNNIYNNVWVGEEFDFDAGIVTRGRI